MDNPFIVLFAVLGSYLYGSIPFGFLIAYFLHKIDIRKEGSGNIGATNIARVLGLKWGLVSFILDASKGMVPFLLLCNLFPEMTMISRDVLLLIASASIIGHDFSCFLHFTGGKGMSTLVGLLFVYDLNIGLLVVVVWILVVLITGYVSVASILTVTLMILWFCLFNPTVASILFAVLFASVTIWKHRENITRLRANTEKVMFPKNFLNNK